MVERKKLGELLLEAKVINATQLQSAIAHQRQWGSRLGTALIEKGFVDEETLAKFLSQQRGMPSVVLSKIKIAPEVLKRIPRELQEKHLLVPITVEKAGNRETLTIAMADPSNLQALDEVKFAIGGVRIKTVIAVEAMIKKAISGDSRQFRPSLGAPPAEGKPEVTDEFAIVRGTMEQTIITNSSEPVLPEPAVPSKTPASATRTPARGVESAPIGEAVLDLDVDPEIAEVEPVQLDASDFEAIVTHVGPPPQAAPVPVPPTPTPSAPDPFLDALRGPPKQGNGPAPAAAPRAPVAAPSRPVAAAPVSPPTAPSRPVAAAPVSPPAAPSRPVAVASPAPIAARGVAPALSSFFAEEEDQTERDIPVPPPPPAAVEPVPPPPSGEFSLGDALPDDASAGSWSSAGSLEEAWREPSSSEASFAPLAGAPWPPVEEAMPATDLFAETVPGPMPDPLGETDLGPGVVPVVAMGVQPLEPSVPEISLPGPEMPEGAAWNSPSRVGAFDPDTAPETDIGAPAGSSGLFSIPSELEVQEGSIPDGNALDAEAPLVAGDDPANPGFEATAADEPMPEYVEPGFETAISPAVAEAAPEMAVEALAAPEMPLDTAPGTFDAGVETMAPTEGDLAPPESDPTAAEWDAASGENAPPPEMTSSTAGMVPSMTQQGSQDPAEATAVGSGHAEPTWDAPMEFTAPPEGSALDGEIPPGAPVADQLRPRDIDEDRLSVTRESPFPMGTEVARGAVMLSPLHVDEGPPPEPEHEATVFSPEQPGTDLPSDHEQTAFGAPEALPPMSPEATPPTKSVPPPMVRVPGEPAPAPSMVAREATPIAPTEVSSSGPAAPATSDEQAALNTLVSKKLKLLNAITEILLEKGLITEEEIREKISKKK